MADSSQQEIVYPEKHPGLQISGVSTVFKKLAQNHPLPKVLDALCLTIENLRDETLCSILLVDKKSGRLSHGAAPSLPDFFRKAVNGTPVRMGMGSCGEAAFTAKRVIVEDILIHPNWKNFTSIAVDKAGLRACWSEPVIGSDSKVLGTFAIYYRQPKSPAREDIELIRGAAHIASIAIEYAMNQEQLKQANAELEQRVIESTAELRDVNEQLQVDIIKRKQVAEALRESRNMLQAVLDSIPSAVFWKDRDSIYLGGSRTWLEVAGLKSLEQVVGKSDYDLPWEKEQADSFREDDRRVIESGNPKYGIIEHYHRADGVQAWAKTNKVPLRDKDGNVTGILGTYEDITERKQAEEALQESEQKYRHLVDSTTDWVWACDIDGRQTFTNKAVKEILGYEVQEIVGILSDSLMHPEDAKRVQEQLHKAVEEKKGWKNSIIRWKHKDGSIKFLESSARPILDSESNLTGFIGIDRDITERKKMEEALLQAQKLQSLGVFAGGIAHDFNNILTTILGNVSMAKMGVSPEDEMFDLLNEAEMASTRAQILTKQLLTFAKGGAPVREIASIKTILKGSSSFVLHGSKCGCEFSIAEDLWTAEVDIGQISQVINNLVINANQAMPEGGVIQVAAENLIIEDRHGLPVKPGRYIRISIKDQGVGISEKHLSNIFDPYFTTKHKGSGLGLATTYSIIKKHDGHITVESQLGVGTTFHIYLPASDKAVPEKEEVRLIKGQGRILVMDDEASLRKVVGRMLGNLGYEPEFAKDGAEAIEMYKKAKEAEKPYDAVILDLTVPGGMGGKEAIKKLLKIDSEVKAIVFSGYSDDPVLSNFQEYGFKGMMPKPFESLSLGKVLYEVLQVEKE